MEKFNKDIISLVNASLNKISKDSLLINNEFLFRETIPLKNARVEYAIKGDESPLKDNALRTFNVEAVTMSKRSHKEFSSRCFGNDVQPRLDIFIVYTLVISQLYRLVELNKDIVESCISLQGVIPTEGNTLTSIDTKRSFKFLNHIINVHRRKRSFFNLSLSDTTDPISEALKKHEVVYQVVDMNHGIFYVYSFNELLNYIVLYMK